MHMTEENDQRAKNLSKKATLRRRKGWKGFVWGYNEYIQEADKIWHKIEWGENGEKSGAKSIKRQGNKLIYKY